MQREKIQKGGKSKGQGLRKVKRDSKNEKRREKSGGREGGKIGCECKRRCFRKGEEEGDHPSVSVSGELVVGVLVVVYVSLVGSRAT